MAQSTESTTSPPGKRRRFLQFSLRTLIVLTIACALGLSWFRQLRRRYEAAEKLETLGVALTIEPGPAWMDASYGKFFRRVVAADLSDGRVLDEEGTADEITAEVAAELSHLRDLRELHLTSYFNFGDEHVRALRWLKNLEVLNLDVTRVSDDGLVYVGRLRKLKKLSLYRTQITNDGLTHLRKLRHLQELDLAAAKISDEGMKSIAELTNLRRLNLSDTHIGNDGLRHVGKLSDLQLLVLSSTSVGDEGVGDLRSLTRLEELWLSETAITDSGLEQLADLPNLKLLSFAFTKVTDAGLHELGSLESLRDVYSYGSKVTESGKRKFVRTAGLTLH